MVVEGDWSLLLNRLACAPSVHVEDDPIVLCFRGLELCFCVFCAGVSLLDPLLLLLVDL